MEHITDFICKNKIHQEIMYVESYNTALIFSLIGISGLFYGLYNGYKMTSLIKIIEQNKVFRDNVNAFYDDLVSITDDIDNSNIDESDSDSDDGEEEDDLDMEEVEL